MPSVQDLGQLYPKTYYSYQPPSLPSGPSAVLKKLLRMKKSTAVPRFAAPGVMLDVGCGAGHYLLEMKQQGWQVYGSELSEDAAAAGRSAGLDIRGGELTDAKFKEGMFDFVRLNHSFEHIPDPAVVLREIRRILKPEGRLFIGVPNIDGLMARIFSVYWWYFGVPVHTYNYNPANLAKLLERHGFVVERLRYYSDYASFLGSLQIYLNRDKRPGVSTGPLLGSSLLKLPAQYLCRFLDMVRLGDCIEVICAVSD
jgi:SAM-dependent methyltransferase